MPESDRPPIVIATQCVVAGGGPAGLTLGFLLARSGVEVIVLEKTPTYCATFAATRSIPRRWS